MNLDKLKDLEAKATPGELKSIALFGYGSEDDDINPDIVLTLVIDKGGGDLTAIKMTKPDENLYIELRNSAKEMISTIERYKTALEAIELDEDEDGPGLEYYTLQRLAIEALKEPTVTTPQ